MRNHVIHGTSDPSDEPNWQPLLDLIGEHLTGFFMWMNQIQLEDDRVAHAYKHHVTRRYLHIAEDGTTFGYVGFGTYDEINPNTAISDAFVGWETLGSQEQFDTTLRELRGVHGEVGNAYLERISQT
ncbi:hypothetical protein LRS13_24975 [Svornostia abyssi]|uniref:Uncharacterized protein n=1 Tax=Svornostia abyssi TaxID=2898438 RepID=A0ABY5PGQ2_9ACTN|nr:hypothetical protein LRS13_24975 [Parviterribacteraceae bacterium J379]